MLKDQGDKVSAEIKTEVEAKLAEVKKVKEGDDATAIKNALDALQQAAIKIGEAMYKSAQGATGQASGESGAESASGGGDKKDEPISGSYEEVKK